MNAEIGCVQMANDIDMSNGEEPVKALLVPGYQRLDFLPTMFGVKLMMRAERAVYGWADQLLENYRGGYWHYYSLVMAGVILPPVEKISSQCAWTGTDFLETYRRIQQE
jgi:hypothetical protein